MLLISPSTAQSITVAVYVLAAAVWYFRHRLHGATFIAWVGLLLLVVLASDRLWWWNHHLVDAIRQTAKDSGWYTQRRNYQLAGVFAVGVLTTFVMAIRFVRSPRTAVQAGPLFVLFTFCLVRAASHHDLDRWFVTPFCGLHIHWWIELLLLACIIAMNLKGIRRRSTTAVKSARNWTGVL